MVRKVHDTDGVMSASHMLQYPRLGWQVSTGSSGSFQSEAVAIFDRNTHFGGLRGAGGMSTASKIAANIDRGFCPKNRSAAVVPSARVRKKLCIAVRQARFLGWSRPRS